MKKFNPILACLIFTLVVNSGCKGSGSGNTSSKDSTTIKDSTVKDTIKSDPSKFSDPH